MSRGNLVRDSNFVPTMVRKGTGVGGCLSLPSLTPIPTTGNWHRLMPHGNDASLVSGNTKQLNIGALRTDLLDVDGWKLQILNIGNPQLRTIKKYENSIVTFEKDIDYPNSFPSGGIEYVLYPAIINPFAIINDDDSAQKILIGVTNEDQYTTTSIKKRCSVPAGKMTILHFDAIDKMFYRYDGTQLTSSDTLEISWGEHYTG